MLKSCEQNLFFSIKRHGVTVAYRVVETDVHFAISSRSQKDTNSVELGRKIALSRLNHHPVVIPNDVPGKERSLIIKAVIKRIDEMPLSEKTKAAFISEARTPGTFLYKTNI